MILPLRNGQKHINLKLKEVPETLKEKITPILRGDAVDKIPW